MTSPAAAGWPFPAPEDAPVLTQRGVVFFGRPVLLVLHDPEGDWQMLSGEAAPGDKAHVVGLGQVVARDPSLRELADLPRGWIARRKGGDQPWERLTPGAPLPAPLPASGAPGEEPAEAPRGDQAAADPAPARASAVGELRGETADPARPEAADPQEDP